MRRSLLPALILLLGAVALADPDLLFERAQTRLAHGDDEGARALLEEALREDPSHGPALDALANRESGPATRLAYLERGRPFDPATARANLARLREMVVDLPEARVIEIERWAILAADAEVELFGPWRPWERHASLPPRMPPSGPLRQEAFGSRAHAHREALQRIAARWTREGVSDAVCWVELSALLRSVGDRTGADAALARATGGSLEDRIQVAERALQSVPDPCGWWRKHRRTTVADIRVAATSGRAPEVGPWFWWAASEATARNGDLHGLFELATAELECAASRDRPSGGQPLTALARHVQLDEALQAAAEWSDPSADVLRARILAEMLQANQAREIIESAARRSGADMTVLYELERRQLDCGREDEASRTREAFRRLRRERGIEGGARLLDHLMGRHKDDDDCLSPADIEEYGGEAVSEAIRRWHVEPFALPIDALLEAARVAPRIETLRLETIIEVALDEGHDDAAFELMERLPDGYPESSRSISDLGSRILPREPWRMARRLRAFAARPALTPRQDAFLRWMIPEPTDAAVHVRIRALIELRADPAFLAQPGSAYAVSLLVDPLLQAEEARRLRRQAYDSGFRPRGLLLDMAEDGDDVLDELSTLDLVSARLIAAIRAEGTEALERFLAAEDAAWRGQRWQARRQLQARRHGRSTAAGYRALSRIEGIRRAWDLVETNPRVAVLYWEDRDGHDHGSGRIVWMSPVVAPSVEDDALGHLTTEARNWDWDPTRRCCRGVLAEKGEAAVRALLAMPRGVGIATLLEEREICDAAELLPAIREQAEGHPMDLRWVELELQFARGSGAWEEVRRPLEALLAAHSRGAGRLLDLARDAGSPMEALTLIREALVAHSRPWDANELSDLWLTLQRHRDLEFQDEALRLLCQACPDDCERNAISGIAQLIGRKPQSAEMDAALARAADPDVRLCVEIRARWRDPSVRDPGRTLAMAREAGWREEHIGPLLGLAVADANAAGDGEVLCEALEELWERDIPTRFFRRPHTDVDPLAAGRGASLRFAELLAPQIEAGRGSVALLFRAVSVSGAEGSGAVDALRPGKRLWDSGYAWRRAWIESVGSGAPGEAQAEVRRVLGGIRGTASAVALGDAVVDVARGLLRRGRSEEAAACVDAWADRCGPLARSQLRTWMSEPIGGRRFLQGTWGRTTFEYCHMPPQALAAAALELLGARADALERLDEACSQSWSEETLRECRLARTVLTLAVLFPQRTRRGPTVTDPVATRAALARGPQAAKELLEVVRTMEDERVRQDAYEWLRRLYLEHPSVRPAFVDDWLAAHADAPTPSEEEVATWEAHLASPDAFSREAAERELHGRSSAASGLLRALRSSADPEVSMRAEAVLEGLAEP